MFYVCDLEWSVHFYCDVFGWRLVFDGSRVSLLFLVIVFNVGGWIYYELLFIEVGFIVALVLVGCWVGMYHFGFKVGDFDDELREVFVIL